MAINEPALGMTSRFVPDAANGGMRFTFEMGWSSRQELRGEAATLQKVQISVALDVLTGQSGGILMQ